MDDSFKESFREWGGKERAVLERGAGSTEGLSVSGVFICLMGDVMARLIIRKSSPTQRENCSGKKGCL